jgi:hypothetical protein
MRNYVITSSTGRLVGVKALTTAQVRALRRHSWGVDSIKRTTERNVNTGA